MYLGPVIRRFESIQDASDKTIGQLTTMSRLSADFCLLMMQNAGLKQYKYTVPVPTENGMVFLETWVILGATGLPSVISWVKIPPRQELGVKTTALFYYNKIDEASGEIKGYFLNYGGGTWTTSAAPATCEIPKTNDRAGWVFWTGKGVNDVVVSRTVSDENGWWDVFWGAGGVEIARIRDFPDYIGAVCLSSGALVFVADYGIYQVIDNEAVLVLEVEISGAVINQSGTVITSIPYRAGDAIHYSLSVTDGLASASQSGIVSNSESSSSRIESSGPTPLLPEKVYEEEYTQLTVPECPNYSNSYTSLSKEYYPDYAYDQFRNTYEKYSYNLLYCTYQKDEFVFGDYEEQSELLSSGSHINVGWSMVYTSWINPTDYIIWLGCIEIYWGGGWARYNWPEYYERHTLNHTLTETATIKWKGAAIDTSVSIKTSEHIEGYDVAESHKYYNRCGTYLFPSLCLIEEEYGDVTWIREASESITRSVDSIEGAIPAVDIFLRSKYSCSDPETMDWCDLVFEGTGLYLNNTQIHSFGDVYASFWGNSEAFNHYGNAVFLINAYPQFYLFGLADGNLTDIGSVVGGVSEDPTYGDLNIFDLIPISGGATNA